MLEHLEVVHKQPLTDKMTQLCLEASMGRFLKSHVLSHGNFMSQSLRKVRHQDSPSAPNGRLQKGSAAEQRLSLSSGHLLKLLHDKTCALEESPFHSYCPKGSCSLPLKLMLGWLLQAITCYFFLVPGLIWIPDYPFGERRAHFNFISHLTRPEVIHLLTQVQDECNKTATMSLFNSNLAKHVCLEEFEQIQTQTFTQVSGGSMGGEQME